jgi:hypothetical protein
MQNRTFISLTSDRIAEKIMAAKDCVIFVAPGLDEIIANAIVHSSNAIGVDNVTICVDLDEKPCRLGYGTIEAVACIKECNIQVRHADNIRIGVLVCDDKGWIFTPTPLLIEAGSKNDYEPNAIRASDTQIKKLIQSINPVIDVNDERLIVDEAVSTKNRQSELFDNKKNDKTTVFNQSLTPEIGQKIINESIYKNVKRSFSPIGFQSRSRHKKETVLL